MPKPSGVAVPCRDAIFFYDEEKFLTPSPKPPNANTPSHILCVSTSLRLYVSASPREPTPQISARTMEMTI
jgi:hypothetical protein